MDPILELNKIDLQKYRYYIGKSVCLHTTWFQIIKVFQTFENFLIYNPQWRIPSLNDYCRNRGSPVGVVQLGGGPNRSGPYFRVEQTNIDPQKI